MAEKPEEKSDFEGLKWLLVFQRIGKSLTGLLLLEIGWVLLLVLAAKLTEDTATPVLGLPGFLRLQRPLFDIANVPESTVWVFGALLIFVGWTLYSRFAHYLIVPVVVLMKAVLAVVFLIAWGVMFPVTMVLLPVTGLLEKMLVTRWIANNKQQWIVNEAAGLDGEAQYAAWLKGFEDKYGPLENHARDKIAINTGFLLEALRHVQRKFLLPLTGGIRIGLAAVISRPRADELAVATPPFPNLGALSVSIRTLLDEQGLVDDVDFYMIPSHFPISTARRARFARRFFGLDMVIWGGYLDEAGQSIWLKFQPPKPAPPDQDSASHIQGLRFEGRLFPGSYGSFTPQVSVVSFSTGDEFEAFTALVLVIVMAMQQKITRERRLQDSWPQNPIWLRNAVRWLRRVVRPDQRFSLSAALDKIILHLLFDAFGKLPDQPAAVRFIPSAADQMALLAGDWIGHQLFSSRSEFDAPLKNLDARRFVRQLRWLCEKCTKIAPKNAEHFYRLGAILCLQGEGERAYLAFKQAEILDVHAYRIDGTMAMVLGEIALQTSVSSSSENAEMAMARFAAHAARAMSSGSLYDITQLRETMVESDAIKLMTYAPERHRAAVTAINVVKRMLDDWAT